MHQALYRTYRPRRFCDVLGQEHVTTALRNAIARDRVSHAYLFYGLRGSGKTSTAYIVAQAINCLQSSAGEPCGTCVHCKAFQAHEVTDIIEIDAASHNGVDEVRLLREQCHLAPVSMRYKVYIIDEVHMLSTGAFNALLKTLEMPPSHVIFILATTEVHKIPATIISRTQRYDFRRIPDAVIIKQLRYIAKLEKVTIDDDALAELARQAQGGLRDAINMLDQVMAYVNKPITRDTIYTVFGLLSQSERKSILKALANNDTQSLLQVLELFHQQGRNELLFVTNMLETIRDIMVAFITRDIIEPFQSIIEGVTWSQLHTWLTKLQHTALELRQSPLPHITVQVGFLACLQESSPKHIEKKIFEQPVVQKKTILKSNSNTECNLEIDYLRLRKSMIELLLKKRPNMLESIEKQLQDATAHIQMDLIPLLSDTTLKLATDETIVFISPHTLLIEQLRQPEHRQSIQNTIRTHLRVAYHILFFTTEEWENQRQVILQMRETKKLTETDSINLEQAIANMEQHTTTTKQTEKKETPEIVQKAIEIFSEEIVTVINQKKET